MTTTEIQNADDFNQFYSTQIEPVLSEIEQQRHTLLNNVKDTEIKSAPRIHLTNILSVIIGIFLILTGKLMMTLIIVALIQIIGRYPVLLQKNTANRQFQETYRQRILTTLCQHFSLNYNYNVTPPFPTQQFVDVGILHSFNTEQSRDLISGNYQGISLSLVHTKLSPIINSRGGSGFANLTPGSSNILEITSTGIHERKITQEDIDKFTIFTPQDDKSENYNFIGHLIMLQFPKLFLGKTIIVSNQFKSLFESLIAKIHMDLSLVTLESQEFNELFTVYSSDQVEARYLLTVSFMEQLISLTHLFNASDFNCAFVQGQFMLAIPHQQNLFEQGDVDQSTDAIKSKLLKCYDNLQQVLKIIDILKLNQK